MKWLYFFWSMAFTSGRIYGNKGACWNDEKPLFIADLNRFMGQLESARKTGENKFMREIVSKAIKESEKE